MRFRQQRVISGRGSEPHQFSSALRAVTVDAGNQVWVVGDAAVKLFDPAGNLTRQWPTSQPGYSIDVDDRRVGVGQQGQLEFYDHSGKLLDRWRDPQRLGLVTAVSLSDSFVLVADSKDRCIRRYDATGRFLNNIGKDNRMKGFRIPNGSLDFSVDSDGVIHACNPGKHRVERYTLEGDLLGHIGRFDGLNPEGFPGCCNPTNVAVSSQGYVYVTEKAGPRAKVYNSSGKLLSVIATDEFDPISKNMDLAVDSQGRVYVIDPVHLQIHAFVPEESSS